MSYLDEYLKVRRANWPYEGRYHMEQFRENGFIAKIDDKVAGFAWADELDFKEVRMKMLLKQKYSEFGIGTELLETLTSHLKKSGYIKIWYSISPEYYAYQIYEHLGFKVINRDNNKIDFLDSVKLSL